MEHFTKKDLNDAILDDDFTKEDFKQAIDDSISDPTGLKRYLERLEEENEYRHEESLSLAEKSLFWSMVAGICGIITILLTIYLIFSK